MRNLPFVVLGALVLSGASGPQQATSQKTREVLQKLRPHFMLGVTAGAGDRWSFS